MSLLKTRGCQNHSVKINMITTCVNSSPPSAAYMCHCTGSALVQVIMACRLPGTKPLPEPVLAYCQFDSWEQISVKFKSEFYHFHSRKCIWNCRLPKWRPFWPVGDELIFVSWLWQSLATINHIPESWASKDIPDLTLNHGLIYPFFTCMTSSIMLLLFAYTEYKRRKHCKHLPVSFTCHWPSGHGICRAL